MLPLLLTSVFAAPVGEAKPDGKDEVRGTAPLFIPALVEKDHLMLMETVHVPVAKEVTVERRDGARIILEKRTVVEYKTVTRNVNYPLKDVKAVTATGKKLEARDLADRLKKLTPVLLSSDGNEVDLSYRRLLKDDTVILLMPRPVFKGALGDPKPVEPTPRPIEPVPLKPIELKKPIDQ